MTTEPSNGTASDDQRCYIERLQRIETAAKTIEWIKRGESSDDPWYETDCVDEVDALRAALEANR